MISRTLSLCAFSLSLLLGACATAAPARGQEPAPNEVEMQPPGPELAPAASTATRPVIVIQPSTPPSPTERVIDPASVGRVAGMSAKRVTLDMREVDIHNALRLFASEGGVNIVAGEGVSGAVTLRVRDAPLDQVFLTVLQSLDLGYERRGDILHVAPRERLEASR